MTLPRALTVFVALGASPAWAYEPMLDHLGASGTLGAGLSMGFVGGTLQVEGSHAFVGIGGGGFGFTAYGGLTAGRFGGVMPWLRAGSAIYDGGGPAYDTTDRHFAELGVDWCETEPGEPQPGRRRPERRPKGRLEQRLPDVPILDCLTVGVGVSNDRQWTPAFINSPTVVVGYTMRVKAR